MTHIFAHQHEQVVFCHDEASGLQAIVALHHTGRGPALGGTRFHPYASEDEALQDVLRLSRGMSYKNALAGLDHGGGKAVILGDPRTAKTPELLQAYGRFVQSLGGRYFTACDVGTTSDDMDVIATQCQYVTGRTLAHGGAGDSSILTAYGVYEGMRASAQHLWGSPDLAGRRVGIAGVGKVGTHLAAHLVEDGAHVVVADIDAAAVDRLRATFPQIEVADSTDALLAADLDVYAPCALGGAINPESIALLTASIVCGAANNQLAEEKMGDLLEERGIVYAPDYCVNSGGVIQVADELDGFDFERAKNRARGIFDTTLAVLERAQRDGITTAHAADQEAEQRMGVVTP